ncbi:hypothetical protein BY996DRAFT_1216729 [Phakopsora pachyrhizi]|nr:hypothetical protein BY996DRAFT_1216729 [Phakopsora pachyrhizi]
MANQWLQLFQKTVINLFYTIIRSLGGLDDQTDCLQTLISLIRTRLGYFFLQQESMKAHFDQQVEIYGDQYLVNLVNSSGYEKPVKDYYEQGVRELGNPRY